MERLSTIAAALAGATAAIGLGLVKDEAAAWLPHLTRLIIAAAARRVPAEHRDRYAEEWSAHVLEYPGKLSQIYQALKCLRAGMALEEFYDAFIAKITRWFGFIVLVSFVVTNLTDRFMNVNFWLDHLLGFANYSMTIAMAVSAYWLIRIRDTLVKERPKLKL